MKVWHGAEHLACEDGYYIVLESLMHYEKKLKGLMAGSNLGSAGTFGIIIRQAASKRLPLVQATISSVQEFMTGDKTAESLAENVSTITSALECYEADLKEVHSESTQATENNKLRSIRETKNKINSFEDS